MVWQSSSDRTPDEPAAVVEAPSLKEALRLVRQRYGEQARVIRSRTVTRRQPGGLGQVKTVEVLIQPGERESRSRPQPGSAPRPAAAAARLAGEMAAEVDRIEALVRKISARQAGVGGLRRCRDNPVAESLVAAGAEPGVVVRLCERCQAETGAGPRDHQALLGYLRRNLPTVRGGWADMAGMHVFLGAAGSGRTELVLRLAARLGESGRTVLVLSLLPRHAGEVRRLQAVAAAAGFDAAVIQKARQLAAAADHLADYDVVLLDAPAFGDGVGEDERDLHRFIIQNDAFHRHLVFPLDRDLLDSQELVAAARHWNCDWLALSRLDQTRRRGKLLNLLDRLPLPVSLLNAAGGERDGLQLASSDLLADLVLDSAGRPAAGESWE